MDKENKNKNKKTTTTGLSEQADVTVARKNSPVWKNLEQIQAEGSRLLMTSWSEKRESQYINSWIALFQHLTLWFNRKLLTD